MKSYIYHYCATISVPGGKSLFDGVVSRSTQIENYEDYKNLKRGIAEAHGVSEPEKLTIEGLTILHEKDSEDAVKEYTPEKDSAWIKNAYPLQQITIRLQGTRHSTKESIIGQLDEVSKRLLEGDMSGECHDDDFGYRFKVDPRSDGPTFFASPARKR